MPIGIGAASKTSSLFAQNALRINSLLFSQRSAQIASGNRLINASIAPSGIAMSSAFRSQLGGIDQAIYNAQDTVNMTRVADSTLSSQGQILGRMRDIALRSANEATLSPQDQARLDDEYQSLKGALNDIGRSSQYNTKQLTTDAAGGTPYGTQTSQVGPDAGPANQLDVTLPESTADVMAGGNLAATSVDTGANAQAAISEIDTAIEELSNSRSNIGITERRLQYTQNDLSNQRISMAASNSTIADTDMASAITDYTRSLLLNRTGIAALSQSNAQGYGVLSLLRTGT